MENTTKEQEKAENSDQYAVRGWQFCKDKLPEEQFTTNGVWENEQLLLVKWDKHDSLELGVLTRINGALIWEIPDHGNAEMSEVSQWMRIPACR